MESCDLSQWDIDAGREPMIRVGVVLPEDDMRQVRMVLPDAQIEVRLDDTAGPRLCDAMIVIDVVGERLILRTEETQLGPASIIRLIPVDPQVLTPGAGIQIRDVVTGRGFHWQKRIHPTHTGTIECRLHDGSLLVINEVPMEHYLAGVITAEMSGDCPIEFLKTQVIVARSWVLAFTEHKHDDLPIDRCNDDDCQRFHGAMSLTPAALDAVEQTRGQVLLDHRGEIIDANYSKCCGGISELPEHVWYVAKSGLKAVVDSPGTSTAKRFLPVTDRNITEYLNGSWLADNDIYCSPAVVSAEQVRRYIGKVDVQGSYFRWRMVYDREDLEQILRNKYFYRQDPAEIPALSTLIDLQVTRRGVSGRAYEIELQYLDPMRQTRFGRITDQHRIRDVLHEKFLYSSAFEVNIERDVHGLPLRIILTGAGWGHGVGMCQIGALGMALCGHGCEEILHHYFDADRIEACYG